ncbi:hypothetical protein MPTK1_8g03520 [Marchantia polymorpha subsp. ruderalis]|nr:hypothetical protein Mp_8g03520 [Marchantia polymorpha subsp. ruderalis]
MPRIRPESVFKADRSGSMEDQMPQLRTALTTTKSEHDGDEAFEIVEREESSAPAPKADEAQLQPTVISLYDESASADAEIMQPTSKDVFAHLPALAVPTRIQTPHRIPPLYPFSRTTVYVLLSGSEPTPAVITVYGTTNRASD